jgi:hypothetical protein
MALVIQVTPSSLNDPANEDLRIYDDGTGDYDAVDNTGGWGAPNPERSEYALYITVLKKIPDGTDLEVEYDNDDSAADTVESWNVTIERDGWYQTFLIVIPVWDASLTYSINQLLWFNDALYRVIVATAAGESPTTAPAKYAAFSDTETNLLDVVENTNDYSIEGVIYTDQLDDFVTYRGDEFYSDVYQLASSYCSDTINVPELVYKTTVFLEGSKIAYARNRYAEADKKIGVVIDLSNGIDPSTC